MIFKRKLICLAVGFSLTSLITGKSFAADEIYIPLVSKGFQHQFWQAVKQGADQVVRLQKVGRGGAEKHHQPHQAGKGQQLLPGALAEQGGFEALGCR